MTKLVLMDMVFRREVGRVELSFSRVEYYGWKWKVFMSASKEF